MSKLGLQLRDALSLSFTKFKIRRIRTALTLITTSVLAFVLVVGSSTLTGVMKAANASPQSELTDLHLASVYPTNDPGPVDPNTGAALGPAKPQEAVKKVRDLTDGKYTVNNVYFDVESGLGVPAKLDLLSGANAQTDDDSFFYGSVEWRSNELIKPYISEGQSIDWKAGDPLPVLVPTEAVIDAHAVEFHRIKNTKTRVAKREEYERALLGKSGVISLDSSSGDISIQVQEMYASVDGTPIQTPPGGAIPGLANPPIAVKLPVRVVGFLPPSGPFSSDYSPNYVFPYETTSSSADLIKTLTSVGYVYPSFATAKERNAFVAANPDAQVYADTVEENKAYFGPMKRVFNIAVVVMLVLMIIPMAATISKLLADSQRETGVFRAIGARNRHIVSIYGLYAILLALASFVVALLCGEAVCAWLTSHYGDDLELAAADFANTDINVSFVRFNPAQLGVILVGLIGGALLGSAIPLLRALRRDPIKALRDE